MQTTSNERVRISRRLLRPWKDDPPPIFGGRKAVEERVDRNRIMDLILGEAISDPLSDGIKAILRRANP